MTRKSRYR